MFIVFGAGTELCVCEGAIAGLVMDDLRDDLESFLAGLALNESELVEDLLPFVVGILEEMALGEFTATGDNLRLLCVSLAIVSCLAEEVDLTPDLLRDVAVELFRLVDDWFRL